MKWSRRGRVLVADPGREFAFVTEEGGKESTIWRYQLESADGGTRITESYELVERVYNASLKIGTFSAAAASTNPR